VKNKNASPAIPFAVPFLMLATLAGFGPSDVAQIVRLRRSRPVIPRQSLIPASGPTTPGQFLSPGTPATYSEAFSNQTIPSSPPDLNALINGVQRKYSRMQGIAADFTQTYQGPDGRALKETGRLLLKRPRKARWDYSAPERKVFLSDGKEIYFYVYGETTATRTAIKESADPQIPFLFLLGQGNLRRDFATIEPVPGVPPAEPGDIVLKLVPKRAPEDFKQLLAEANPVSFEVRRLVIFARNGSRMDFLLTNVRENYIAPDAEFVFTPPPGVIVKKASP
jgi:outer membrane lipoprotein carrier protein